VLTGSAEETEALGGRLAGLLALRAVVTVAGELGSGKTTFVRGACRTLGVTGPVTSPTFTIGHRYEAPIPVAHLDLYRFRSFSPEEWGDLEPYFDGTIAFVEWPEHADDWLPAADAAVRLEHLGESERRITIRSENDLRL